MSRTSHLYSLCTGWPLFWKSWKWFSIWFCKKTAFFGSVLQNLRQTRFFWFGFCTVCCLMCMHSIECFPVYCFITGILPCWISPTNRQPKWLRTRNTEILHEEKYFDCWSYHVARWVVSETTWKTVPKQRKSVLWKPNCGNWVFGVWILRSFRFSLVRFLENRYLTFSSGSAHH